MPIERRTRWLGAAGIGAAALSAVLSAGRAESALDQAWPAFALVTGLLLVGAVAHRDALFELAAAAVARAPGGPVRFYAGCLVLVAAVSAVLNLDTAAVFLTPVLVLAARRRALDELPFLYGTVFMANAASLFLPGSNLTNLIVLADQPAAGATFAARLLAPALAATAVTGALLVVLFHRRLRGRVAAAGPAAGPRGALGLAGVVAAAALIVALRDPALPVLGLGLALVALRAAQRRLALVALRAAQRRLPVGDAWAVVNPPVLAGLLGLAVALGTLARAWDGPAELVSSAGRLGTAVLGAGAAVLVNNLPASVLLASAHLPHPRALLLGLNLGPNLAVTGSLSAFLWFQAARTVDARPSVVAYSRYGLVLAPAALAAALAVAST